jgi:DNA-binding LytR/AlgR family response regulator
MKPGKIHSQLLLPAYGASELRNSSSIIRIEAMGSYSKLFFDNGKTSVVSRTLCRVEAQLPLQQFIRIHRTHLVNKDFISRYINETNGKVQLVNGERICVARRNKSYFLQQFYASIANTPS